MQNISIAEIVNATDGKLLSGQKDTQITEISTDSRKIKAGCLFIPLKGEKFDGHDYIDMAFEAGAAAVVTQIGIGISDDRITIKVEDTLKALRDIAAYYRKKFNIPFIAITGSVGKTSTKDFVAAVIGRRYNVLKTEGNFNNEIGVPLTVFNLDSFHEAAVLEMGMSGAGEISRLTAIVRPDIAIITNVGISHIEKLGSRQNILKAKMEILEGLDPKGLVILNGDDAMLSGLKDLLKFRTVLYGMDEGVHYRASNINSHGENGTYFDITVNGREYTVHIPVPGVHNVQNTLAAIAAGCELGISMEEIISGINDYKPTKMRLDIVNVNGIKVINDSYNASPQSMEAALNVLRDIDKNSRKIAVLGDMLELGEWSQKAHYDVGKLSASGIDLIIAVGKYAKYILNGSIDGGCKEAQIRAFENTSETLEYLKSIILQGDVVLVKGSRGMKMEEIVKGLQL